MSVLFALDRAHAEYGRRRVLFDINLTVNAGERLSIFGKSGAGKSTLLALLFRQRPQEIAFIPQSSALVRTLSVFHNVYMGRLSRHPTWYNLRNLVRPARREIERIAPILGKLDLEEKMFAPAGALSGGQQQRTLVARALYNGGRILLGDEPVSAVDEYQARAVVESMIAAHETIILAMHDVDLALEYTDRIIGLRDGRIVFDQCAADLSKSDLKPFYDA